MAELTLSEFHEIRRRQSVEDFKSLLALLERDEELILVEDPLSEEEESEGDESELVPVGTEAPEEASSLVVDDQASDLSEQELSTPETEEDLSPVVDGEPAEGEQVADEQNPPQGLS